MNQSSSRFFATARLTDNQYGSINLRQRFRMHAELLHGRGSAHKEGTFAEAFDGFTDRLVSWCEMMSGPHEAGQNRILQLRHPRWTCHATARAESQRLGSKQEFARIGQHQDLKVGTYVSKPTQGV